MTLSPSELSTEDLRRERTQLQAQEDVVSYARRMAQGWVDVVDAEYQRRRADAGHLVDGRLPEDLPAIIGHGHGVGAGSHRAPHATDVPADHPLVMELEQLCAADGLDELGDLSDERVQSLLEDLIAFEKARSDERRQLFERIDAFTAELVERYRTGSATVDTLLDAPE